MKKFKMLFFLIVVITVWGCKVEQRRTPEEKSKAHNFLSKQAVKMTSENLKKRESSQRSASKKRERDQASAKKSKGEVKHSGDFNLY